MYSAKIIVQNSFNFFFSHFNREILISLLILITSYGHPPDPEEHSVSCTDSLAGIYLLKINNRNTRTRCEICST